MTAKIAEIATVVTEARQDEVEGESADAGRLVVQEAQGCLLQQNCCSPLLLLPPSAHSPLSTHQLSCSSRGRHARFQPILYMYAQSPALAYLDAGTVVEAKHP